MSPVTLLFGGLLAGELIVHATVPVDVYVAETRAVQLLTPGQWRASYPPGTYNVTLLVAGTPRPFEIEIPPDQPFEIVVAKSGISISEPVATPEASVATVPVEVRCTGNAKVVLVVDGRRYPLDASERLALDLSPGRYDTVLLNGSETITWARGVLEVHTGESAILQVAEGYAPEAGGSSTFRSSGP